MPNIYLRLPTYVCAFYRNRDINHPLPMDKPVVFVEFSQEYVVLSTGLRILSDDAMTRAHCWSQVAWRNMMHGRNPGGDTRIIRRTPDEWLTYAEVRTLSGEKTGGYVSESYDYLCIGIPKEVVSGGRIHRTNASYSLAPRNAQQLEGMMRHEFQLTFLDWLVQDRRFCNQKGIARSRVESIERFLMTYDIPVSTDNRERESLRRMTNRWLNKSKHLLNDRLHFEDGFFRHLTDNELMQIGEHVGERKKK